MNKTIITTVCDTVLGSVFVWAGLWKWVNPGETATFLSAILSNHVPVQAVQLIAVGEWVLGIWMLSGRVAGIARVAAATLLLVFTEVLVFAVMTGVPESCGCLGLGESIELALVRNAALIITLGIACFAATAAPSQVSVQLGDP